ncbi:MAG: hypothetical protein KDD50_09625 [Bdellovibrionales bacterium]|nr:hypothetical protein [Bdellovibrionales bacterium]
MRSLFLTRGERVGFIESVFKVVTLFAALMAILVSQVGTAEEIYSEHELRRPMNQQGAVYPLLTYLFDDEDIFKGAIIKVNESVNPFEWKLNKTGTIIDEESIDDPDFYLPNTKFGRTVRSIYGALDSVRNKPLDKLPWELEPIRDMVYDYIQKNSETKDKRSEFYSGVNGQLNGQGFTFAKTDLPEKITKLSFCFGIDPFVFSGLIQQESKFSTHVVSDGKAVGFTQLTSAAFMEVNEQLGILDKASPYPFRGKGAKEVFENYISCYLGSNKQWVNVWEDPTSKIPVGVTGYVNENIKDGRKWRYISRQKKWLAKDPDRYLIYGAIQFKLLLGRYSSYPTALARYNVSHAKKYINFVSQFYQNMNQIFNDKIKENPDLFEAPYKLNGGEPTLYFNLELGDKVFAYTLQGQKCLANMEDVLDEVLATQYIKGFMTNEENKKFLYERLKPKSYCQLKATGA